MVRRCFCLFVVMLMCPTASLSSSVGVCFWLGLEYSVVLKLVFWESEVRLELAFSGIWSFQFNLLKPRTGSISLVHLLDKLNSSFLVQKQNVATTSSSFVQAFGSCQNN